MVRGKIATIQVLTSSRSDRDRKHDRLELIIERVEIQAELTAHLDERLTDLVHRWAHVVDDEAESPPRSRRGRAAK
jgi:hypothetical protein